MGGVHRLCLRPEFLAQCRQLLDGSAEQDQFSSLALESTSELRPDASRGAYDDNATVFKTQS
jgi:hypothetical protein